MAANELVREDDVVICDYLMKECQNILEKRNKWKKRRSTRSTLGNWS
jgi:ATP-dependent protease Clp ATPase subunit